MKVPCGLAGLGSPKMGAAPPRGLGRREWAVSSEEEATRGQRKPKAPGAPKGFPQSGNEPWGGAFRENVSAPQHASALVNPLGKDPGSRWRTDCGELKKLTCATIKRAAALSHSPQGTEIESSRTGRGGTWLLPPVPGEEDKKGRWTWRWPRPSNAPILGS